MTLGKGCVDAEAEFVRGESGFVEFEVRIEGLEPVTGSVEGLADERLAIECGGGGGGEFDRFAGACIAVVDLDAEFGVVVARFVLGSSAERDRDFVEEGADAIGGHAEVDIGNALVGFNFESEIEFHRIASGWNDDHVSSILL